MIKLQISYYKYAQLHKRKYEDSWKVKDIKKNKIKLPEKISKMKVINSSEQYTKWNSIRWFELSEANQ